MLVVGAIALTTQRRGADRLGLRGDACVRPAGRRGVRARVLARERGGARASAGAISALQPAGTPEAHRAEYAPQVLARRRRRAGARGACGCGSTSTFPTRCPSSRSTSPWRSPAGSAASVPPRWRRLLSAAIAGALYVQARDGRWISGDSCCSASSCWCASGSRRSSPPCTTRCVRAQQLANETKHAEPARDVDNPLRALAQFAPAALFMTDASQGCTYCNRAWLGVARPHARAGARQRLVRRRARRGPGAPAGSVREGPGDARAASDRIPPEARRRRRIREVRDVVVAHVRRRGQVVGAARRFDRTRVGRCSAAERDAPAIEDPSRLTRSRRRRCASDTGLADLADTGPGRAPRESSGYVTKPFPARTRWTQSLFGHRPPYAAPPRETRCSMPPRCWSRPRLQHALASHDRGRGRHARRARELPLRQQGDAVRGGARAARVATERSLAATPGRAAQPGRATVADVLRAWWRPFIEFDMDRDTQWGNYLLHVLAARRGAATARRGTTVTSAPSDRDFQQRLRASDAAGVARRPRGRRSATRAGSSRRSCSTAAARRAGRAGRAAIRDDDIERALRFAEAGMRGIAVSARATRTRALRRRLNRSRCVRQAAMRSSSQGSGRSRALGDDVQVVETCALVLVVLEQRDALRLRRFRGSQCGTPMSLRAWPLPVSSTTPLAA